MLSTVIKKKKLPTSPASETQVWESPDISKANRISNGCQQILHFSAPSLSFFPTYRHGENSQLKYFA